MAWYTRTSAIPLSSTSWRAENRQNLDEFIMEYDIPHEYSELNELRTPTNFSEPRNEAYKISDISSLNIDYDNPGSFMNLGEVAIPAPVENTEENAVYEHGTLEERLGTDIRAPPSTQLVAVDGAEQQHPETLSRYRATRTVTELYTVSYLIFFSIFGTLARLGIESLVTFPGMPVAFSTLWANFSGTFILGFLAEFTLASSSARHDLPSSDGSCSRTEEALRKLQEAAQDRLKRRKASPLYIGLATGFCGSFTSFSSFVRDIFLALSNSLESENPSRSPGDDVMALLAVAITTIGTCLVALKAGAHLAIPLARVDFKVPPWIRSSVDRAMIILALGTWAGAVVMTILPPDRFFNEADSSSPELERWRGLVLFSLVFAPLGCLSRFYLSLKLNGIHHSFPIGTFLSNIIGTVVLGMAWDLQHAKLGVLDAGGGSLIGCQVLQGIMDGYCGALTTVSTWIAELASLRRVHAYIYGSATLVAAVSLLIAIMGSLKWTAGWIQPACALE